MKRADRRAVRIDEKPDPDYEAVRIVGCRPDDEYGSRGRVVLRADGGTEFSMRVCTGELVHHIAELVGRNRGGGEGGAAGGGATAGDDSTPIIYRMIEEICEACGLVLVRVEIDGGGGAGDAAAGPQSRSWRASLYMAGVGGGEGAVLRGYRAPDAVALASLYNAPILFRRSIIDRAARNQAASAPGDGYMPVRVSGVGFVDRRRIGGLVVFESDDGRQFPMTAFTGEVARIIGEHASEDRSCGEDLPTVYRMVERVCSLRGLELERVRIYESGQVMRANLYLAAPGGGGPGETEGDSGGGNNGGMVLRNYRASDATVLATLYDAPILVSQSLAEKAEKAAAGDKGE